MNEEKIYKFVIEGRPRSQKNDIKIMGRGARKFIGHSKALTDTRNAMCDEIYRQFIEQGGTETIDYLIDVRYQFFHPRQWEPDVDNLPAIVLDAMQGRTKKVKGEKVKFNSTIKDDKLVRFQKEEKIIKGDDKYDENRPDRTEFTIRRYYPKKDYF